MALPPRATTGSSWIAAVRAFCSSTRADMRPAPSTCNRSSPPGPTGPSPAPPRKVLRAATGGNRILVFSPAGALVRTIGSPGAELGQLKQPMGLSFGPDGALYVTDFENNRLERWDDTLQATNAWPLTGHSWGVAVDRLSRVFVPDADHSVVRMYSPRGDLLAEIGGRTDSTLGVVSPTQVGLTPDGSALWVLG